MFIGAGQVRLTPKEQQQLLWLTGEDPSLIKTTAQLEALIRRRLVRPPACCDAVEEFAHKLLLDFLLTVCPTAETCRCRRPD